jgi:hypothetical protein
LGLTAEANLFRRLDSLVLIAAVFLLSALALSEETPKKRPVVNFSSPGAANQSAQDGAPTVIPTNPSLKGKAEKPGNNLPIKADPKPAPSGSPEIRGAGYDLEASKKTATDFPCTKEKARECVDGAMRLIRGNKLEEGKSLLRKGCGFGEAAGCLKLGVIEERGGNKDAAMEFYQKACDLQKQADCPNVRKLKTR